MKNLLFFILISVLLSSCKKEAIEPKQYHTITVEVNGSSAKHIEITDVLSTDTTGDFKYNYALTSTNRIVSLHVTSNDFIQDDITISLDGEIVAQRLTECPSRELYLTYDTTQ